MNNYPNRNENEIEIENPNQNQTANASANETANVSVSETASEVVSEAANASANNVETQNALSVDVGAAQDTRADIPDTAEGAAEMRTNRFENADGDNRANATTATNAASTAHNIDAAYGEGEPKNANGTGADPRGQTAEISYSSVGGYSRTEGWQYIPPKKEKKHRSSHKGLKVTAIVAACALLFSAVTFGAFSAGNALGKQFAAWEKSFRDGNLPQLSIPDASNDETDKGGADINGTVSTPLEEILNNGLTTSKELTVGQIAEKCRKSSVGILVEIEQNYFGRVYTSQGVGSGFILSEDGYIATNNHVVEDASRITVVLDDGTEYEATLVGTDSITDIAVVKIEAENLPVMELGNSDEVAVGDLAVAIGTPASIELRGTVTDGIISAVNRDIDITDDSGRVVKTMTLIQTNATINPGNSGGPLINRYGQVIGINTMKLTDEFEGIGFAIPINGAVGIINQLITDGVVTDRTGSSVTGKPSIGITTTDISEREAAYYGVPQGVLIIQINKSGSAAKAGLRRGDIIVAFEGEEVTTTDEITERKNQYKPGDEVTLTVYRDGEENNLDITFALDIQS